MNTVDKLRKEVPEIQKDELEVIDREIKRFVASVEEDFFAQSVEYIYKKLLKYNRYGKDNFLKKCKRLAKIYLKNENAWMTQENIFCLLALIYSCVSLILRIVQEVTGFSVYTSDLLQVIILCIILIVFVKMCESGGIYDNLFFNSFLKQFNRIAPSMTIVASLLFYLCLIALPIEWGNIKIVLLVVCVSILVLPILWALDRTRKTHYIAHGHENKDIIQWVFGRISRIRVHLNWKKLLHNTYQIISVISTLAVFTGTIYFVIGKVTNNNQSDNDLIMRQIKADIGENQQIVNIEVEDIHGFGNDSIIVTTANENIDAKADNNKLVILETVENEILNSMNDWLGLKSNYRITFSYGLIADDMLLYPEINCVSDILGDSAKEILINYYVWGSTYGAYYTAVYKYSYELEKYELVGSYPIVNKHDVSEYDEEGNIWSSRAQNVVTKFNDLSCEDKEVYKFTDYEKSFNLTSYSYYCRDYWAEFSNMSKVLVVVKRDKWEEEALINVYHPSYDEIEDKLNWRVIYSENTADLSEDYTKDELAKWMENKFDCRVNMY